MKKIKNALISVYHKDNLDEIVKKLKKLNIKIISTGGTFSYIEKLGVEVSSVESITSYPSILGGRVKTLHPKIFGGILTRRENENDNKHLSEYDIPEIDLVIVDLYPFEETVKSTDDESEIIEKIDIGGISLIRAAAKNYKDVIIIPAKEFYEDLNKLLDEKRGFSDIEDRKYFAKQAFNVSSHYDTAIFNYFNQDDEIKAFKQSINSANVLRYGENPHQQGIFYGELDDVFEQLHGKAISYNNLLDIDAAVNLIMEFSDTTFAILKHNNACGIASRKKLVDAWKEALSGDPVSAFGGILVTNATIDKETAEEMNKLFFEAVIAPYYDDDALEILKTKKNRMILKKKSYDFPDKMFKSILNGALVQDKDEKTETPANMATVTKIAPTEQEKIDLAFANILVKHTKSNAMILVKDKKLLASGVGQTSRVDALRQAIEKANSFKQDLKGAVLASDAFFPFPDNVEIAHNVGITAVIQPGGSINDKLSIDYCNENDLAMVFTGTRHFKH
ncbi:MAG: bifunctional phosphoribosylaminoimidazolecarboxamide formyltransferase/IMP cyclohydrolase [Saprospiraceae bacterium]|nr:bifunctional phosphoribosylaminoimidazolecarboxamide formyltransferase/IMP cyclohydrolase [Saprospiraceae bacterium]